MRGSLRKRYKGSWSLILDVGAEPDPATGVQKRKQKWITFRGTRQQAEAKLNELLTAANGGTFVEPSKITVGGWLSEWLEAAVKPTRRPATYTRYKGIIEENLVPAAMAKIPLQKLRSAHLEAYYAKAAAPKPEGSGLSPSTVALHHAILHRALRKAKRDNLVSVNVAADLDGKPRINRHRSDAQVHCWTADEARNFLAAAKAAGPQAGAFYALALDSGMEGRAVRVTVERRRPGRWQGARRPAAPDARS